MKELLKYVLLLMRYSSMWLLMRHSLRDFLYYLEGIAETSYTDDTIPNSANKTNDLVIKDIEHFSEFPFHLFDFNYMKINSAKSHILFSGNDNVRANIDNTLISENKNELLGIIFDSKLSFEDHINNLCKKVSQKRNASARVVLYMCLEKKENIYESICNISIWVLSLSLNRGLNNEIHSLYESVKNNIR